MAIFNLPSFVLSALLLLFYFATDERTSCQADTLVPQSSTIKLENGQYNGIFIGIDGEKIDQANCSKIIEQLNILLPLFSEKLYQATDGRASLGQVNLLLPRNWNHTVCDLPEANLISDADSSISYDGSNFQITEGHPMTANNTLPWTKQYRPCGQPSDNIIIPRPFVLDDASTVGLSNSIKAQLLLHEWTKFRYGAFDEFGYDDEENLPGKNPFSPCYTLDKQAYLSCCTNSSELSAVALEASACTLEFLLNYEAKLRKTLAQGSSSVMSSPYIESVNEYCTDENHNRWSLTKQNLYCNRRSVADVVFSHSDFPSSGNFTQGGKDFSPASQLLAAPTLQIWKHPRIFDSAYAFVIQDTTEMRDQFHLQHVKRAISQIIEILQYETEVLLVQFSNTSIVHTVNYQLRSLQDKQNILSYIPDTGNQRSNVGASASVETLADPWPASRLIAPVTEYVVEKLATMASYKWNVFLFTQNSPGVENPENDMREAINAFENTSHTISITTFDSKPFSDTTSPWLLWYGIPHTKNVATLLSSPRPTPPGPYNFQPSSFIVDHFVGILNDQPFSTSRRFLQNPVGTVSVENKAGTRTQFQLQGYSQTPSRLKSLYIFVSVPETSDNSEPVSYVRLINPINKECDSSKLLSYSGVWTFSLSTDGSSSCQYHDGVWAVEIDKSVPTTNSLLLNVWVELNPTDSSGDSGFKITSSLGRDPKNPVENAEFIPIFVTLQTVQGFPVLNAQLSLWVYSSLEDSAEDHINAVGQKITLLDDGNSESGADQTGNDGVYSAYLNGILGKDPAFYVTMLNVETTPAQSKILETTQPSKAILMESKITRKCCGKVVQLLDTHPMPQLRFQTLHLGFQTMRSPGGAAFRYPPSQVSGITVLSDTETDVSVQFTPAKPELVSDGEGEAASIKLYQGCCVKVSSAVGAAKLNPPADSNCQSDTMICNEYQDVLQTCTLQKRTLVETFIPAEEKEVVQRLICGIRAVNTKSEFGSVSQGSFEIDVSRAIANAKAETQKCTRFSTSDKCLPIWIFWVLIGLLALLLIIVIFIICWWCCPKCRKEKNTETSTAPKENILAVHYTPPPGPINGNKSPTHNRMNNNNEGDDENDPKVVKELFVNHAYIQDGDGEIKIIANNGQLLKQPRTNVNHQQRRDTRIPMHTPSPPPMDNNPNMQIFKPAPKPPPSMILHASNENVKARNDKRGDRLGIVHQNQMLRSDSSFDTAPRGLPPQQPTKSALRSPTPNQIPSDPILNYATISRTGRPSSRKVAKDQMIPGKQVTFDPHYMVPHSSASTRTVGLPPQAPTRQTRDPPFPRTVPPQLPHYPTTMSDSDSTTTEDGRYGQQQRPRRVPPRFTKPPPYPTGSQLIKNSNDISQQQRYSQHPLQGAVGGHLQGQSSVHSQNPPVPPPRYDRQSVPTPTLSTHSPSTMQSFSNKRDVMTLSDDDDSDEWDDGDNYEIYNTTAGASYA